MNRLVWTGGGFGGRKQIVWVRNKEGRSSSRYQHKHARIPSWVTSLRRKRVRPPRVTNHSSCACGDDICNDLAIKLGTVFTKTCSWTRPPSRPLNSTQLDAMPMSKKRKAVRAHAIQSVVKKWRREASCEVIEPSEHARFNEVHFPRRFLNHLKSSLTPRKTPFKRVPTHIPVEMARKTGMYRQDLVVGKTVVVVPNMSCREAQQQVPERTRTDGSDAGSVDSDEPDFEGEGDYSNEGEGDSNVEPDSGDDNGQHLLVVGCSNSPAARSRNCGLEKWFAEVTHVQDICSKASWSGVENKINFVCVDYADMTPDKYHRLIFGDRDTCAAGEMLVQFVKGLQEAGVLELQCVLQLPRHDGNTHWEGAMTRLTKEFGKPRHVNRYDNPLCITPVKQFQSHLAGLTGGEQPPFCQFVIKKSVVPLLPCTPVRSTDNQPDRRYSVGRRRSPFSPRARRRITTTSPSAESPTSVPRMSPEGISAIADIQSLKTGADEKSAYVDALEQVTDRLAQDKVRLVRKLEQALRDIEFAIEEIERERGELFSQEERQTLLDDIRAANPTENDTDEPIFCDLLGCVL